MALAVAAIAAPSANAQEGDVEEVVVTGSRLTTNSNLTSPSPVLQVGQEEIDFRGTVRVEDLTNVLPQVFAGQASEVSNGATGTATLNLRGLGAQRTLVLIDGKRLPFGSPQSSPANLDLVPTQLIERIEIVTGGASAVYGSDAVGGVANFILRDDFEGVEFETQGGFYQAGNGDDFFENVLRAGGQPVPDGTTDGRDIFLSMLIGANSPDDRGNVTMFFQYQNQAAILQSDRMESGCALGPSGGEFSFGGLGCVGSANFRLFGGPGGFGFQQEDGTITPFQGGPAETFNFGPFNYFQRPNERFTFYTKGRYDITDDIEVFADLSFVNNTTDAQIAPSASFGFGAYQINCDNPLIQGASGPGGEGLNLATDIFGCVPDPETGEVPDTVSGITASHRNVEGGPRNSNIDLSTWRMVGGVRGTFAESFDFEAFGQFARTLATNIATNDFVVENLQDAFLVVEGPDGQPVCQSGNLGCLPYNIFQRGPNGESLVTQEVLDYIQGDGIVTGETEQVVFGATVQTNLGDFGVRSPAADDGIGVLVGTEYREDSLVSVPDEISRTPGGGFTGVGGADLPVSGELKVFELFTEAQAPLVSGVPGIQELTLSGAYRWSDYTTSGNDVENEFDTSTWFGALTWSPIQSLRLRGQYQRAIRSPNVIELFTGQDQGLASLTPQANGFFDPCAGPNPLASQAACANTGVTAAQYGNIIDVISGQTAVVTGGNPFLDPETSDTFTVGAVFTPDFLPGFSLAIDYFDIEVDDAVSAGIPVQTILDECIATGDPTFCTLIQRDPQGSLNSGTLGVGFQATNLNLATLATSGVDVQMLYDFDFGMFGFDRWSMRLDYAATFLNSFTTTPFPGAEEIECAGLFAGSCGTPNPEYRHRLLATFQTPWPLTFTTTWRYFGGVENDAGPDAGAPIDATLDAQNYLDLSANYFVTDNLSFRAGVLNMFGNTAPVTTAAGAGLGNGNTYPTVYDATGRFFFFGATSSF